jgi:signal transduction histidine kinase
MIWMRRDDDFSSSSQRGIPGRIPVYWVWVAGGLGVAGLLLALGAPTWQWAAGWAAWGFFGLLWFQRDAHRPSRPGSSAEAPGQGQIQPNEHQPWADWLTGWYWRTNARQQLILLRPGLACGELGSTDWDALSRLLATQPGWCACWDGLGEAGQPELARLHFALTQGQPWSGSLVLPWPARLGMLQGLGEAGEAMCEVRGGPVHDAQGRYLGHQGVLSLLPQAEAGRATTTAAETHTPMNDGEQEALRYALSHDLRAPLRVVEGFTRIVKEDYGRFLDRIGHDHLDRVLAASARMNGMIDAILSQAQLAGASVARADIDLSALAREVGSEMAVLVPSRSPVSLWVADGMHTQADMLLLRRVMENLIGNAMKYSAKVDAPRVEVGVMPATNPAVYFVRDNGAGFDMQHAEKLFGLFQRLHSAKDFPGTGVGLAGVQHIIRRHGGRVWAEARPGQGACFYFTLSDASQAQSNAKRVTV